MRGSRALRWRIATWKAPNSGLVRLYGTKTDPSSDSAEVSRAVEPVRPHGSTKHHDKDSFLRYAETSGVSKTSTVYIGTLYEYNVIESLKRFGFDLTRTGRPSDFGIDLLGNWKIPSTSTPLRTLAQCKARSQKLRPESIRELEGAFTGAPAGWRGNGVFGFLIAAEAATKGMRDALSRSQLPLGFLQITRDGKILQFLWNHSAGETGLEGLGVTLRHSSLPARETKSPEQVNEIVLTWNGKTLTE